MFFIYILLFLNMFFLSYEIVIFNEEFFIAFMFFSFFFIASPAIINLLASSYSEDRSRVFSYVIDDIFNQYSFLNNYIVYLSLYESNKEFLFQYISFLIDGLFLKFINFYENLLLNNSLPLVKRIPEVFFLFCEKLLNFMINKFYSKFLDYFLNKWDNLIFKEITLSLEVNNLGSSNSAENLSWTYGNSFL
jgi:hypothetical protein